MNNARTLWRDDDVIGHPGQQLTPQEIAHLVAIANGNTPSAITAEHGTSRAHQQQIESGLRAKLGAESKPHMIARAFVLHVLIPRALVVALMLATLGASNTPDAMAQRLPRRGRNTVSAVRVVRSSASSASSGSAI